VPPPHPAIRAILVCDLLIRDERTRKVSLIGITEQIDAQQFPWTLHSLFVWATITDGQGDYRIRLDLVRLEDLAASHILDELDVTLHDFHSARSPLTSRPPDEVRVGDNWIYLRFSNLVPKFEPAKRAKPQRRRRRKR